MELKKERTQKLNLPVLVNGEVTTYTVQVLFRFGIKEGETPYKKWSIIQSNLTIEEAEYDLKQFKEDGIEARIVKITTKAEVI